MIHITIITIFLLMLIHTYLLLIPTIIFLSFLPLNVVSSILTVDQCIPHLPQGSCPLILLTFISTLSFTSLSLSSSFFAFNTRQFPTNLAFFTSCFDFTLCSLPQFLHFKLFFASSSRTCLLQPYRLGNWPVNFPDCSQDIDILEMSQVSSFDIKTFNFRRY
jgi:hypothetical protein